MKYTSKQLRNPSVRCLKAAYDIAEGKKHALELIGDESKKVMCSEIEILLVSKFNYSRQSAMELREKFLLLNK